MLFHVVLGFLRNGSTRHGYELLMEYRACTGERLNPGNLYRELARLAADHLVEPARNPPGTDARRIPYQITDEGRQAFDAWLLDPSGQESDFPAWALFLDHIPADVRQRALERRKEELWMRGKTLTRQREDAIARGAQKPGRFDPLPSMLSRKMRFVGAEVDFLKELEQDFEAWQRTRRTPAESPMEAPAAVRTKVRRTTAGRR